MAHFPTFMKNPANRIASGSQHTPGITGFVFDGVEGSQMACWECDSDAVTAEHGHALDEYGIVVEGSYVLIVDGKEMHIKAGQEYFIPKGSTIAGRVTAGTRTIHVFGGHRADRQEATATVPR